VTVTAEDRGLDTPMDPRFGRAARFLVVDPATRSVLETLDNASRDAAHGAGTSAASLMHEQRVDAVISGRFGPKAFEGLRAMGIATWVAPPGLTAAEALDRFGDGGLEQMELREFR
jgi:predicted Fe-Mo cluster-binding NifX family protein